MPVTMHQTRRDDLLNRVHTPKPLGAKLPENFVHTCSRLLRKAIDNTGMNQDEAMRALGVKHKGQFSEMLDGKRKLWAHQFLRPEAKAIRKELLILSALEDGSCEVERVVRIKERA